MCFGPILCKNKKHKIQNIYKQIKLINYYTRKKNQFIMYFIKLQDKIIHIYITLYLRFVSNLTSQ